ncbi:recombinase RecT [Levilactobacillus lindianensis]|uniref:recombinase RecT n=1 Tax=Levilactobacillus lindianensis TaxID=2486018 RepID=UPI000F7432EB
MANELVVSVQKEIGKMQKEDGLQLPQGYSVGNALNSAWLILSDDSKGPSMLQKCDPKSVSKALLNMAIQGLSPAKNQCYFIPYGRQCTLQRSYFGSITVLKQLSSVKDIKAQVIFKDDGFEIGADDDMNLVVKKYEPKFENRDNPIIGAFAYVLLTDNSRIWTVMTKKEIDASWSQAKSKNVQNKFGQEMAQRTIINRAAKLYINSSNDNDLFVGAINDTTENESDYDDEVKDVTPKTVTDLIGDKDVKSDAEKIDKPEVKKAAVKKIVKKAKPTTRKKAAPKVAKPEATPKKANKPKELDSGHKQPAEAPQVKATDVVQDDSFVNALLDSIEAQSDKEDDQSANGAEQENLFEKEVRSKFE